MNSWPILKPIATANINYQENRLAQDNVGAIPRRNGDVRCRGRRGGRKKYKIEIIP